MKRLAAALLALATLLTSTAYAQQAADTTNSAASIYSSALAPKTFGGVPGLGYFDGKIWRSMPMAPVELPAFGGTGADLACNAAQTTAPVVCKVIGINGLPPAKVATSGAYGDLSGVPAALPPSGLAGGDLGGTFPSPLVVTIGGKPPAAIATSGKLSDATGPLNMTPPSDLNYGFSLTKSAAGSTSGGGVNLNLINNPSDTANVAGPNFLNTFTVQGIARAGFSGGRQALQATLNINAPSGNTETNGTNENPNYVGAYLGIDAGTADNGTALTRASAQGGFFAMNPVATAESGATNLLELSGAEFNIGAKTGSSMLYKFGMTITSLATDKVHGTAADAMIGLANIAGAVGWNDGILFSNVNGTHPIAATGNLIRTTAASVGNGIDLSLLTVTGCAYKGPGEYCVDNSANISGRSFIEFTPAAPTDAKNTLFFSDVDGAAHIRFLNDSNTAATDPIIINRSGYQPTSIAFAEPASAPSFFGAGTAPTLAASTGTVAGSTGYNDTHGTLTPSVAQTITVTFGNTAYANPRDCVVTAQNGTVPAYSTTAQVMTITATSTAKISYHCLGS